MPSGATAVIGQHNFPSCSCKYYFSRYFATWGMEDYRIRDISDFDLVIDIVCFYRESDLNPGKIRYLDTLEKLTQDCPAF